jgi:hypothetical protein
VSADSAGTAVTPGDAAGGHVDMDEEEGGGWHVLYLPQVGSSGTDSSFSWAACFLLLLLLLDVTSLQKPTQTNCLVSPAHLCVERRTQTLL